MASDRDIIKSVLTEMGYGLFVANFERERVDSNMIASLTDGDLTRLGLQTMGDRFYFRKRIGERISGATVDGGAEAGG